MEKMRKNFKNLLSTLTQSNNDTEKNLILDSQEEVNEFLSKHPKMVEYLEGQTVEVQYALKSVIIIGEGPVVFNGFETGDKLEALVSVLLEVERFYDGIGGIIGYHNKVLELIEAKEEQSGNTKYHQPAGLNLGEDTQQVRDAIRWGIESLPEMCEIYPVGGAGDRLNLIDEQTGEALPAAQLQFLGRSLLEGLIRDLEAREYLYFKLTGNRVITPIAMMTSLEKNNEQHILKIIEETGRAKESIITFQQPLVPVITSEGHWSMQKALTPTLKPGGHGVIWKLAKDKGIFKWLNEKGRTNALIRQINNPVAGTDQGLLAFTGIGCHNKNAFGFASCQRRVNTAEGMNVVIEKEGSYTLSNIEYTEFKQKGIIDAPIAPESPFSKFPSNTNILFADLDQIEQALKICSIPGMTLNLKSKSTYISSEGAVSQLSAGRLETTMQNISDYIASDSQENLKTYLTYNDRRKTISVTKKSYTSGNSSLETPVGCFQELMENSKDLLENHCAYTLPNDFIFIYHPALGPLYKIIGQKINKGTLAQNSEIQLEIAEVDIKNLMLDGSLIIDAKSPLEARCTLQNITIKNQGIDQNADNVTWKNQISRKESLTIEIHGSGEFVADGITFNGHHHIIVPDGYQVTAYVEGNAVQYKKQRITSPSWSWEYSFDARNDVALTKKNYY